MEASADPFAEEATGTDPFAEDERSAVEQPPVVDREGQRVEPSEAGKRMAAEAEAKAAATTAEPETETATEGGQEPPQKPPAAPPATDEPTEAQGGAQEPEAAQERGTRRLYKLLYQTDKGQWTEAPLDQWSGSEYVTKQDGEFWIAATTADQVRRLGYVFFQRPADGVTLLPVAKGAWKPMRVKQKQVPARERLEFESA